MATDAFRIVLAFDGSPASLQAARVVRAHTGMRTEVLVLNVQPRDSLLAQGEPVLEAARAALEPSSLDVQYLVQAGYPPEEIVAEARDRAADAIVAGFRARAALMPLASVATATLEGSEFPALLVKDGARIPPGFGKRARVLLATDGSEYSARAAELVATWRGWLGEVHAEVVHARDTVPLLEKLVPPSQDPWRSETSEDAQAIVQAAATALSGCASVTTHVRRGDPATCIARVAGECEADLVVMGTRGRGARLHAVFGSVATKTIQWTTVPVVLVP